MPLTESLQATFAWWLKRRAAIWKAPPRKLFHYTSGPALHDILQEHTLRGSSYMFMNDRSEFAYGRQLMQNTLTEAQTQSMPHFLRSWLEACVASYGVTTLEPYLVSFCAKSDLLSQWRGYGGRNSRYCIVIDTRGWKQDEGHGALPQGVIYSEKRQREILREIIDYHIVALQPFGDGWDQNSNVRAVMSLMQCAFSALSFFKHPSFSEEREYRSVYLAAPDNIAQIRFINTDGVMKPFRLITTGSTVDHRLPIVEVIAGAASRNEQTARSAELMLASSGYGGVPVTLSRIPLSV